MTDAPEPDATEAGCASIFMLFRGSDSDEQLGCLEDVRDDEDEW